DHPLLHGQIAVVGLDNPDYFSRFHSLFSCNWDLVDCALICIGDYKQCERNGWRHQLGSKHIDKAWITLFHKSANQGFHSTKEVLSKLLSIQETFDDKSLKEMKEQFIAKCEMESVFDWRYYYVKYAAFRPGRYGKYSWKNPEIGFYDMHVLWTESKWSENSYQPFLYEADTSLISRDDLGHYLVIGDDYISCENDAFRLYRIGTDEEMDCINIRQNEEGIDLENRISKLKKYLQSKK
ncbi:MAG: DUF262 domain-containing protein, partial [Lachnospiraceae bacterium]